MTKNILIGIAIFPMLVGTAMAGPFGLSMGMKKSDFKGELKEIAPYKYKVSTVPKMHSTFEYYVVQIGPESGLCYIKAIGKNINTNIYGIEVKSLFDSMESKLKKSYGKYERMDFLLPGSIWSDPQDWMPGLVKGERVLGTIWNKEKGATLNDNLKGIGLVAHGISREKGYLVIEYNFINIDACDNEVAAVEDGAL